VFFFFFCKKEDFNLIVVPIIQQFLEQ